MGSGPTMPLRQFDRIRRISRARLIAEQQIEKGILSSFRIGWRRLYPTLRSLEKANLAGGVSSWFDTWSEEFSATFREAIIEGTSIVSAAEFAYWPESPLLDPTKIADSYILSVGARIGGTKPGEHITETTKQQVSEMIDAWLSARDSTIGGLQNSLGRILGPIRAHTIAVNETTGVVSSTTEELMRQLGMSQWVWQASLSSMPCSACGRLHGQVFSLGDPFPPFGSHIGCCCMMSPIA